MEKLYGKFRTDSLKRRPKYIITTDKDELSKLNSDSHLEFNKREKKRDDKSEDKKDFGSLNSEIFDTFVAFYDIVPLLVAIPEKYPSAILENEVVGLFRAGEKVENDESFESYAIDVGNLPKIERVLRKIDAIRVVSPMLRRFYIMGLVSHYDYFVYEIAKKLIDIKPHIVFKKDAQISFVDLEKFENIADAKQFLVEKELESLLRDSHEEQLKWFSKALDIKMEPRADLINAFVELCERRNLFAHNGGRVSSSYLKKLKKPDTKLRIIRLETFSVYRKDILRRQLRP